MPEEKIDLIVKISPTIDDVTRMSEAEITQWTDERKFSILMVAAEAGDEDVVNYLIERGTNVNCEVNNETPASLAFSKGHHDIVLALLKANSLIPSNYNRDEASNELKTFTDSSENLHATIRGEKSEKSEDLEGKSENIEEIFTVNPSVRHFYDSKNNSALRTAMICAMFAMIEVLIKNNIFLAPHEDLEDTLDHMTERQRDKLRDLFLKFSPHIFTDTMMALMRNCHFGPDGKNHPSYMSFACKAFHVLLENPLLAIILKIVAATRDFVIVFDFNRECVDFVDPTSEPYINGNCYLSGKIYVGAKDMLVPEKAIQIISVMAHELCHYAMFLVFSNWAKPYRESDKRSMNIFKEVSEVCKKQKDEEELVGLVYDDYPTDSHHAELAVRAPQMIAFYHGKPELDTRRSIFPNLFTDYEHRIIPEMEKALPAIKDKFRPKHERKIKNLKILTGFLILCLVLSGFIGFWFFKPTYNWAGLSEDQKMAVKNANLTYRGAEVKLGKLFADNSTFYDSLLSDHIENALKGEKFKLTIAVKSFYDGFVFLIWSNMTESLRDKFLSSKVNFQGKPVELRQVLSHHEALNSLNTSEIRYIFDDSNFKISSPVEIKTKFFIERSFVSEDLKLESINDDDDRVVDQIEVKNSQKVFDEVQATRAFLLSDKAGEGKSTTFRNFALKLKQKYPGKWVQFLDLKKHDKAFTNAKILNLNFTRLDELKEFLGSRFLDLKDVESQIFLDLFDSGNVVFLYDGVDEISPKYNDLILNLMKNVKKLTENLQFVSTRPQHSVDIQDTLEVKAHKFLPLNEADRWNLFVKFVMQNNPEFERSCESEFFNISQVTNCSHSLEIQKIVEQGKRILKSIESSPTEDEYCESTDALQFKNDFDGSIYGSDLTDTNGTFEKFVKLISNKYSEHDFRYFLMSCPSLYSKTLNYNKKLKGMIEKSYPFPMKQVRFDRFVVNPLLIEMIGEVVSESEGDFNFYSIYEVFVMKKLRIVYDKGEIARKELTKFTLYSLNVMQAHQAYAVKLIHKNLDVTFNKSSDLPDLRFIKSVSKLSNDEISRFGILHVTSQGDFEFAHRTFAEFFVAKFLIESLNNFKDLNEDEREFGLEIFGLILMDCNIYGEIYGVIKQFLMQYLQQEPEMSGTLKEIKGIYMRLDRLKLVTKNYDVLDLFTNVELKFLLKIQNESDSHSVFIHSDGLIKNFEKLQEMFGFEVFHYALTSNDYNGKTFLHVASETDNCEAFLMKLNQILSKSEWKSLIFATDKHGKTSFDYAFELGNAQAIKLFNQIIEENLNLSEQEKLASISNYKVTN